MHGSKAQQPPPSSKPLAPDLQLCCLTNRTRDENLSSRPRGSDPRRRGRASFRPSHLHQGTGPAAARSPSPLLLASCFLPCGPSHAQGHYRCRPEGRLLSKAPVTAKGQPSSQGNAHPQQAQVTSNPRPPPHVRAAHEVSLQNDAWPTPCPEALPETGETWSVTHLSFHRGRSPTTRVSAVLCDVRRACDVCPRF